MRLTRCGLGDSHTLKFPCEMINFDGAGIFLSTMLLSLLLAESFSKRACAPLALSMKKVPEKPSGSFLGLIVMSH
jgi:hypothetical protein